MTGSNPIGFIFALRRLALGLPLFLAATLALLSGCMKGEEAAGPDVNTLSIGLAVPPQFSETQVVSGLSSPTAMAFAPDGRLFICEQGGRLRVVKNGALLSTPFATVSTSQNGERGLLGITFDPDFAVNRHLYVYYTASSPNTHNRVSRFTASGANGDVAEGGETILLDLDALSGATNHNGGALHFGLDGKLYIAVGENATPSHAQTLANLHGKMLRINKDGSIPTDNPFYGQASGKNRAIWNLGLRNPFTFTVQPGTGRIFINDVGQDSREEINDGTPGANFGWPNSEGNTTNPAHKSPFHSYANAGSDCAITGGAFYNPPVANFPAEYTGDYFYADYCGGWINRIDIGTKAVSNFATGLSSPVDLKVGPDGALYYLVRGGGIVRRVSYTASQAPVISTHPANRTVSVGQTAAFSVTATGSAPLSYQWLKNGTNIGGATSASYTTPATTTADNGALYRVRVTNSAGNALSNEAILTVTTNRPPVAAITTPTAGTLFSGGQALTYSGTGTDPDQGNLPGSAFTWQVDLHHDSHSHPFVPPTTGSATGSFTIPTRGETSDNIWYRVSLTVRDNGGLTHTVTRDILPRKATVTLAANPSGLQLTLDGQPVTAPHTFTGVVGIIRSIGAVSPQTNAGGTYTFTSWSDGGAATHEISTPAANATFTAAFTGSAGTRYEAESALLSGPIAASGHAGYTGTGYADYQGASNDFVEWTVNAPAAGSYRLDFRYALVSGSRPLAIRVNGTVVAASHAFPSTGAWTTWSLTGLNVNLVAGSNKVRATAIGSSGPNVDHLMVR